MPENENGDRPPAPRSVAGVKPPAPLVVGPKARDDYIRFRDDWNDYAIIQSVATKTDDVQVALFRTALGTDGKALLRNQPVPLDTATNQPMDKNKVSTLVKMLEIAVIGEVNETYETFIFRSRVQKDTEEVDEFVNSLRELIKTCGLCDHKDMREKFLRDQIIFGIKDNVLREKLLQERKLTLHRCLDMCRAAESASAQAKSITEGGTAEVSFIKHKGYRRGNPTPGSKAKYGSHQRAGPQPSGRQKHCRFCGRDHEMSRDKCPAYGEKCLKCQGWNHFAIKCTKRSRINRVSADDSQDDTGSSDGDGCVGTVSEVAAVTSPLHTARMRVQGRNTKFLLDSGASISLISTHHVDMSKLKISSPGKTLRMWNGATQRSLGTTRVKVFNPKTRTTHTVEFEVVSEKLTPVLGCAAVQQMGVVTMETDNYERVASVMAHQKTKEDYVKAYPSVFAKEVGHFNGKVSLQIDESVSPTALPARRVPLALQEPVKKELRRLEDQDVIMPVTKPTDWVSQMVAVRKSDSSLRICIDPIPLNRALKRERYRLPTVEDILPELHNAKVLTKCDLRHGYWHCELDDKSSDLTTFQSPTGSRYKWKRLPFGLSVSSEIFERKLMEAFEGLKGVHVIADDVLIAGIGDSVADATVDHDKRFQAFLDRCAKEGIVLNQKKFHLRQRTVKLAGFLIGEDGVRPDPDKVKAIMEMPAPTDVTGTRRLLGVINFLAKFIPHLTTVVKPIQALLAKDSMWIWGPAHDEALSKVKALISCAPVLGHFDPAAPLVVQCDASQYGLGAVIMQNDHPLAYASRSLTQAEQNYAQIEKELLSVVFAMEKFHTYTYGRHVTVQNDHKPLVSIQTKLISKVPMRLQRMLMRLQTYDYQIAYVPGKDLHLADALSRACLPSEKPGVTFDTIFSVTVLDLTETELQDLQRAAKEDLQMQDLCKAIQHGWPEARKDCHPSLTPFWDYRDEMTVCQGLVVKGQALLIPKSLRPQYIKLAHQAHQGYDSCVRLAKQSIFWPNWKGDLKAAIERCDICAQDAPQQCRETLQQPATPTKAWKTVSSDIMTLNRKDYLVTVDNLSGYIEVDRLRQSSARAVILKLRTHFARYGSPQTVVTDNGPQFASQEFEKFAASWRFEHRTSSPHYPRSNGQAEAAVKTMKQIMRRAEADKSDVYKAILDHRNTPRQSTGLSPAEILLNRPTRMASLPSAQPPTRADKKAMKARNKHQEQVKAHHDLTSRDLPPLPTGTRVWFLQGNNLKKDWQKGNITGRQGNRSYHIRAATGGHYRRNRVHIKPDLTESDVEEEDESDIEQPPAQRNIEVYRRGSGRGFVPPMRSSKGRPIKQVERYGSFV